MKTVNSVARNFLLLIAVLFSTISKVEAQLCERPDSVFVAFGFNDASFKAQRRLENTEDGKSQFIIEYENGKEVFIQK